MANDNTHIDWEIDQGGSIIHPNNTPGARLAALVKRTADWNDFGSSAIAVPWDAEEYDIGGWHDNATNNTRLTVPSGVSRVLLQANIVTDNAGGRMTCFCYKNGSSFVGSPIRYLEIGSSSEDFNIQSAEVEVTSGDYFEVMLNVNSTTRDVLFNNSTWFFIRAIE